MNQICSACSMPLSNPSDFGVTIGKDSFCIHCITAQKTVKSCHEIFEGGVAFFMSTMPDLNRDFAKKIVRKNMNKLPYWNTRKDSSLNGPEASDKEFEEILKRFA